MEHMVAGAQNFPEITRAHYYSPFVERKYNAELVDRLNAFQQHIYDDLLRSGAVIEGEKLRQAVIQAMAASIFGIGLLPELYAGFAGQDFFHPQVRREYLQSLARRVLRP